MQVNKNSWHYKVLSEKFCFMGGWGEWDISKNLCTYFWQVMFRLLTAVGLGIIVLSPLFTLSSIRFGITASEFGLLGSLLVMAGLPILFFVILGGMAVIGIVVFEWVVNRPPYKEKKNKEPNLIISYIKAKKEKVCPIIEFTEE